MEKPKRLRYSDLHDMYNADEIDAYLDYLAKTITETIAKDVTKHYLKDSISVERIEEVINSFDGNSIIDSGGYDSEASITPIGAKQMAAAIHKLILGDNNEKT